MSFKVGGKVVFDITKPYCAKLPGELMEWLKVSPYCQYGAIVLINGEMFEIGGKAIRHATPDEIAAGRRIEIFGNSEELEVLEMIDVSPNCEVSEI